MSIDDLDDNPTARSIEILIGHALMEQLSCDLAGARLYIAANPGENSPLVVSVGLEAARKIGEIYAGTYLEVPVALGRRAEILKLSADGMSNSRISRRLKCSLRQVRRVVNEKAASNQLSFFK